VPIRHDGIFGRMPATRSSDDRHACLNLPNFRAKRRHFADMAGSLSAIPYATSPAVSG
jgi:hypothetical protein